MTFWLYPDGPVSGDPEEIRAYIADLRSITPQTMAIARDIAVAEAELDCLLREQAESDIPQTGSDRRLP